MDLMDLTHIFLGNNIWDLMMRFVFLLVGVIFTYVLVPRLGTSTRILYCRERDGRGEELDVKIEDEVRLDTKNDIRFFKHGRSYAFAGSMRRLISIFFAKEGTAYTAKLMGFSGHPRSHDTLTALAAAKESAKNALAIAAITAEAAVAATEFVEVNVGDPIAQVATIETAEDADTAAALAVAAEVAAIAAEDAAAGPTQITLDFPTVWEAVKFKLGKDFLRPFPEKQKKLLQDDKFLVTVDLEPGLTPEGYKPATEQDIADKGKRDMAKLLGEAARNALHGGMIDKVPWIGVGIAIGIVGAMAMGWIPVGIV